MVNKITSRLIGVGVLALLLFCACQPTFPEASTRQLVAPGTLLDPDTLSLSATGLDGSGRIEMTAPLAHLNSHEHYVISGEFQKEQGFLRLHSHFNGFELRDGVEITLAKLGSQLIVSASGPAYPAREVSRLEDYFTKTKKFQWRVEVHNQGAEGFRVLIWNNWTSLQGEVRNDLESLSLESVLIDTKESREVFQTRGAGVLWGLELQNLHLEAAHSAPGLF